MEKINDILLKINAININTKNKFTWTSGIKSPIYTDNRLILSFPKERRVVEEELALLIKNKFPNGDIYLGMATAGIGHGAISAFINDVPFAYIRSSTKNHGKQNLIEGQINKNQNIVIIEDLVSTGKSVSEALEYLKNNGYKVVGIVSIFTYGLNKSKDNFKKYGISHYYLSDIQSLTKYAVSTKKISEDDKNKVLKFIKEIN